MMLPLVVVVLTLVATAVGKLYFNGLGYDCPTKTMTRQARVAITKEHNRLRSSLANGREVTLGGVQAPTAKNMYKLFYDCDFEMSAQEWADRCGFEPGEFLIWYHSPKASKGLVKDGMDACAYWWSGLAKYGISDKNNTFTMAVYYSGAGWFNQMAWGSATRIGCGIATHCYYEGEKTAYVVCKYDTGNVLDDVIYELGSPCKMNADCTTFAGSKCLTFEGLCVAPQIPDYTYQGLGYDCPTKTMTRQARVAITSEHNNLRSRLANGQEVTLGGGQAPTAKNMYRLLYDCDLERSAQEWADSCNYGGKHNLNWFRSLNSSTGLVGDGIDACKSWWSELAEYGISDKTNAFTMTVNNAGIHFFSQMAWGSATRIGCGIATHCHYEGQEVSYVVCQYDTGNNYYNVIYELGSPCEIDADCTTFGGSKCVMYENLCVAPQIPDDAPEDENILMESVADGESNSTESVADHFLRTWRKLENTHIARREMYFGEVCKTVLTPELRDAIVIEHNRLRSRLAKGYEDIPGGRKAPTARNMYKVGYGCLMERSAQQVADRCVSRLSNSHYGENIVEASHSRPLNKEKMLAAALEYWWSALKEFGFDGDDLYATNNSKIRYFAQMAWATTTVVGCGYSDCSSQKSHQYRAIIVCHYGTIRLTDDQPIYEPGPPCAKAADCGSYFRKSTCSADEGLCEVIEGK